MARSDPQINIRIPQELKARIEEAAKANGRSMNAELVARLQTTFDFDQSSETIHKGLAAMELRYAQERFDHLKERSDAIQLMRDLLSALIASSRGKTAITDDHLRALTARARELLDLAKRDDPKVVVAEFNKAWRAFQEVLSDPLSVDLGDDSAAPMGNDTSENEEASAATPALPAEPPRRRMITNRPKKDPSSS